MTLEDNDSHTVAYQYDGNDRVTRRTDPRSKYIDYAFDDGVLDYIDLPKNQGSGVNRRQTRFSYDDSSRVNEVFAQTDVSTELSRMRVEFDGFSNLRKLVRLRDSLEMLHQFNFDKLDRLLESIDPLLRETNTEHAPFCTERTVTTPRGVQRTYRFDSLCRLVQVETGQELVTYDYDELGRAYQVTQGQATRYGKVTSIFGESQYGASANRVTLLEYDELDRVTQVTFPDSETVQYEYDEEGAVTQMTDVHGKVTRYTYYNDGRLYEVILERPMVADRVFTYSYDAAGRLAQIDYPSSSNIVVKFSGPSSEPGWDEAGNLLHMRYLLSNAHLHRFAYTYDDAGNRISMTDTPANTANAVLWEYGYDWLDRLTSVSRDSTLTTVYTYDESDNRRSLEWPQDSITHDFTYDDANQIVQRKLGLTVLETYAHDQDGNMITRVTGGVTTQYRWNDKNRLVERKVAGVSAERQKYDVGGIRESKSDGTKYFSSGAVSIADMRPSSVPVSYFQGHQLLGMEIDGDFYYYVTDGLANVRLVLDSSGSIVASTVFEEFGIPEDVSGSAALRPHGYTGGLGVRNDWDSSGLHYMRQRYYDSSLGRWLSADPIGFKGGLNLYTYVGQNPINNSDPSGLDLRIMMVPQGEADSSGRYDDASGTGHVWVEVVGNGHDPYSVGAYEGSGLQSPDPHSGDSGAREVVRFPATPGEDSRMVDYFKGLVKNQKPGQWYANSKDPNPDRYLKTTKLGPLTIKTPDPTKMRVCTTVARELTERTLNPSNNKVPTLFQPNNLWNHYHPNNPLPAGNFQFKGVPAPP